VFAHKNLRNPAEPSTLKQCALSVASSSSSLRLRR
jgi:hypothetical protein